MYGIFFSSTSYLESNGGGMVPFNGPAHPDAPFAAYHNPSQLGFQKKQTGFSYIFMYHNFDISLKNRSAGLDIDESIFRAREYLPGGGSRALTLHPLPTSYLKSRGSFNPSQQLHYMAISLNQPLIPEKLVMGAVIMLPVTYMQQQSPFFIDEREQYFSNSLHYELYEDRYQMQTIAGAFAFRPHPSISLGVGMVMNMYTQAVSALYMPDATDQDNFYIAPQVKIAPTINPYFGTTFRVRKGWSHSLTLHLEESMTTEMNTDMSFFMSEDSGFSSEGKKISMVYGFLPLRADFGSYFKYRKLEFASTIGYQQWSSYRNRMGEEPYEPWLNTLSLAIHANYKTSLGRFGLGMKYQPTPVPEQEGRENYVDSDRLSLALSWKYNFTVYGRALALTMNLQYHHLLERNFIKNLNNANSVYDEYPLSVDSETGEIIPASEGFQTNNPGYPGYSHGGGIFAGSVMLTVY